MIRAMMGRKNDGKALCIQILDTEGNPLDSTTSDFAYGNADMTEKDFLNAAKFNIVKGERYGGVMGYETSNADRYYLRLCDINGNELTNSFSNKRPDILKGVTASIFLFCLDGKEFKVEDGKDVKILGTFKPVSEWK